ncbi:Na(+)-translocating NADH-quinone reductase subunit B [Pseudobythopirellula maris]|uniref:Na(+)-translocating NADH-quinone reductase subunit B n=1 Tax=Pseudobythopirellula maris TaxID=2527991 RepID=A0A5C5ZT67_9BACT|nr:NADH:ubiquinone reductase (Na(+)-transporting) subunit B [Pseudobythopirellula maris]TWT90227.1 Na(+)-translocating NADH-quinone reductase subunit B [Pseudobythopirellula maris]
MKFLRQTFDLVEPHFTKGGKLEKLYPVYESIDTFLFTPGQVTKTGPHVRDSLDMKRMMSMVIIALGPCILMAMYNTGYQANLAIAEYGAEPLSDTLTEYVREPVMEFLGLPHDPTNHASNFVYGALWFLPVYLVTMVVGGHLELLFAVVRGHEINEGFLVTGMLFPLTLPPTIPLWQVALGIAFGVVIGKEIFGGTGKNFLNPALTGRAFLYFAHASFMSGDKVWTAAAADELGIDGYTNATTLTGLAATQVTPGQSVDIVASSTQNLTFWDCFWGLIPGSMGETSTFCCLLGAAILIASGIGSWRIMSGVVLGALAMGAVLFAFRDMSDNPLAYMNPFWHLVVGGFAFGTVFMATDPVSASMTETGKWWYGGLIGVMTILIRTINPAFAEGIMLAILFGNVMAPLIDYAVIQGNVKRRAARYATT